MSVMNKLTVYCVHLEQAIMWEICKNKNCRAKNCIFKKIKKQYGEHIWSKQPMRIASLDDVKENLALLTKPRRVPVLDSQPFAKKEIIEPATHTPEASDRSARLPSDIIKDEIIDQLNHSN